MEGSARCCALATMPVRRAGGNATAPGAAIDTGAAGVYSGTKLPDVRQNGLPGTLGNQESEVIEPRGDAGPVGLGLLEDLDLLVICGPQAFLRAVDFLEEFL